MRSGLEKRERYLGKTRQYKKGLAANIFAVIFPIIPYQQPSRAPVTMNGHTRGL